MNSSNCLYIFSSQKFDLIRLEWFRLLLKRLFSFTFQCLNINWCAVSWLCHFYKRQNRKKNPVANEKKSETQNYRYLLFCVGPIVKFFFYFWNSFAVHVSQSSLYYKAKDNAMISNLYRLNGKKTAKKVRNKIIVLILFGFKARTNYWTFYDIVLCSVL